MQKIWTLFGKMQQKKQLATNEIPVNNGRSEIWCWLPDTDENCRDIIII